MDTLLLYLFIFAALGVIGTIVGELGGKSNGGTGFLLGFFLGPIGWIIVAVLPPGKSVPSEPTISPEAARIAKLEAELKAMKSAKPVAPVRPEQEAPNFYNLD